MNNESIITEADILRPKAPWQAIKFTGNGFEYFKIWIVNLLLTLLTLGIFSAWATVRTRRYFYGNTHVNQGRFDFHGSAIKILFGRIIAFMLLMGWTQGHYLHPYLPVLSIAIVFVLLPWFMVRGLRFRLRNTSLFNLRFNFLATPTHLYKVLGAYLLIIFSLTVLPYIFLNDFMVNPGQQPSTETFETLMWISGATLVVYFVIFPAFVCDALKIWTNSATFGQHPFSATLDRRGFISTFIKVAVVAVVFIAFAVFLIIGLASASGVVGMVVGVIAMVLASTVPSAFWQAYVFNQVFDSLNLDGKVEFMGEIKVKPLIGVLLTNTLIVLCTFGFGYPWAAVRLAKYKLECISYQGDFEEFEGVVGGDGNALGDEVGSAFDVEFGF